MKIVRKHLSYANVMATLGVFIALGLGSAYAADKIGSKDIAKNAVKAKHIAKRQVKTPKIAKGAISNAKLSAAVRQQISDLQAADQSQQAKIADQQAKIADLQGTVQAQESLLAGVSRRSVGGIPTLRFSEMNLQLVNGSGSTVTTNGRGNLIIGYGEQRPSTPATRTGSHYLVVGQRGEWTGYGGILAGYHNTASGPYSSVLGGSVNTASGNASSVSGGNANTASGPYSSVSGGSVNTASEGSSSVSGGSENTASGGASSVSGGIFNTASGNASSILGGQGPRAVATPYACHPACP